MASKNKTMTKCKNASRYKGIHPPRCDGGRGCIACWDKYNDVTSKLHEQAENLADRVEDRRYAAYNAREFRKRE